MLVLSIKDPKINVVVSGNVTTKKQQKPEIILIHQ